MKILQLFNFPDLGCYHRLHLLQLYDKPPLPRHKTCTLEKENGYKTTSNLTNKKYSSEALGENSTISIQLGSIFQLPKKHKLLYITLACKPAYGQHMLGCQLSADPGGPTGPTKALWA